MNTNKPTASDATLAASHPYTCNTCQVAYRNIDLQKTHMRSDWHRYNLKRRVASLPPISADIFAEKVLQARAASHAEADKALFERHCDVCQKSYYSENAYRNHLMSQKHRANQDAPHNQTVDETMSVTSSFVTQSEAPSTVQNPVDPVVEKELSHVIEGLGRSADDAERPSPVKRPSDPQAESTSTENAVSDDKDQSLPGEEDANDTEDHKTFTSQSCIFCNYDSPTTALNLSHMERFHGMFIPEKAYLVDLDGLLNYLQRKVHEYQQCVYCDKIKATAYAVQTHMRDTGHCKIPYTTEDEQLEIGEYYDFRSTYSDGSESEDEEGEHEPHSVRRKLGARRRSRSNDAGDNDEDDGEGWETDSSASSLDSADLTAVPAEGHLHQFERLSKHPHHSRSDPRHRHRADGWHSHAHKHTHAVFYDDYEMHLPSGRSVGHRSLNKYYRQNLHNHPTPEERQYQRELEGPEDGEQNDTQAVVPRGTAGMLGVSAQKRHEVRKVEDRGRQLRDFHTKRNDYKYGKKLNNQKNYYYRYERGG